MAQSSDYFNSSETPEWYTPEKYVEAARRVMGAIDLDPASCEAANGWIKAERYYSLAEKGEDALKLPWSGRIWLNPPFNQSEKFCKKLIKEYEAGNITQAIALFKFVPSYKWFAPLKAFPMVVTDHRVSFWEAYDTPGKSSLDTAVCFVYFGPEANQKFFEDAFSQFGHSVTFKAGGDLIGEGPNSKEKLEKVKALTESNRAFQAAPNWGPATTYYFNWKKAKDFALYRTIIPTKGPKQFLSGLKDCASDFLVNYNQSEAELISSEDGGYRNVYGIRNQWKEIAVITTLEQGNKFFITLGLYVDPLVPWQEHWEIFRAFANGFHCWLIENWEVELVWQYKEDNSIEEVPAPQFIETNIQGNKKRSERSDKLTEADYRARIEEVTKVWAENPDKDIEEIAKMVQPQPSGLSKKTIKRALDKLNMEWDDINPKMDKIKPKLDT